MLQKQRESNEVVGEYLDSLGDAWTEFVNGELQRSNELDNKTLGAKKQDSFFNMKEDEDDNDIIVNHIIGDFSEFNDWDKDNEEENNDGEPKRHNA